MNELLERVRAKLAEQLQPYIDADAIAANGLSLDQVMQQAVMTVSSELSHQFVLTPRSSLMAVIRECEADSEKCDRIANRVVLLQIALAKSRLR